MQAQFNRLPSLKFRAWIELEEQKEKLNKAAEEGNLEFSTLLVSFLSAALNIEPEPIDKLFWGDCLLLFLEVLRKNRPRIPLPIIVEFHKEKIKENEWDYDGRLWHLYSHLLAKTYGWSLEYIAELDVDEALAKIQEILTDEQLEREFLWSMSEVAYPYDALTKTSKFNPLPRPFWMKPKVQTPKKTKILKSLMPMGMVKYEGIDENLKPKEIEHP